MSIAQTPNPGPASPVTTPTTDPDAKALAQSGQTSRPVIVRSNGARTRRWQSGQILLDNPMTPPARMSVDGMTRRRGAPEVTPRVAVCS